MTKIKKVFFLFMLPFNREDWLRYDMKYLIEKGIEPYYVDLSNLFFNTEIEKPTTQDLLPYLKTFETKKDFKDFLIENKSDSILALDLPLRSKTTWLYRIITSLDIRYIGLNTRWFPRGLRNKDKIAQLKRITPRYLYNKLRFEIEYQSYRKKMRKADAVFLPNDKSRKYSKVTNDNTKIYYSHSSDYDRSMLSKDDESDEYIVFIDVYYPDHPDLKLYSLATSDSSEEYHENMNKMFHILEERTGKKVIICAHPRRPRDKKHGFEFPIVYNKTAEYIKQAYLVVNHYSTAVNYVVIHNKPMLFVTLDAFSSNGDQKLIEIMASRLGSSIINVDHLDELNIKDTDLIINKDLYSEFMNENIKHSKSKATRFGADLVDLIEKLD